MIEKVLFLKMVFKLNLKFVELLYLPDVLTTSIICASTVYWSF